MLNRRSSARGTTAAFVDTSSTPPVGRGRGGAHFRLLPPLLLPAVKHPPLLPSTSPSSSELSRRSTCRSWKTTMGSADLCSGERLGARLVQVWILHEQQLAGKHKTDKKNTNFFWMTRF